MQRGDIVVFQPSDWTGTTPNASWIKRVVGIGGDIVECCDDAGELTVNGVAIDEPYVRGDQGSMPFATRVPDGSVFLLGDWRDHSQDSRFYVRPDGSGGSVPVTGIEGIVVCVGSELLPPATAFTDAGLGATRDGDLLSWPPFVGLLVSPVLVVLGLVGLVIGLVRRLRH